MRILTGFAALVGLSMLVAGVTSGASASLWGGLAVAGVAGALFWRSLRNPEVTRKMGSFAQVTFAMQPGPGVSGPGTYARVATPQGNAWDVALDRLPVREDMDAYDIAHRGWVWLAPGGLPEKVRIDYGTTWKNWPVLKATETKGQMK
ncbi:hypothetical protein [Alterinioella nitratireducens]|uniref:hypothetical protein n=1 Tax=Alterinioella nitratireducens TaxID=2735915 RepID=UPI004057DFF8